MSQQKHGDKAFESKLAQLCKDVINGTFALNSSERENLDLAIEGRCSKYKIVDEKCRSPNSGH